MEASQERTSVVAYQIFPPAVQKFWEQWNLRFAVLSSLSFQIILIFSAPERKRSGNLIMQAMIWISYLLADWVAAFAVGLISSSQGQKCEKAAVNDALAAFWAPFLLLHLGGPDTITAFSLEDNELWIRHMFSAIVQGVAVGYVFIQSLPNEFWLPTVLMFSAGTFKYFERTRALYLACLGTLKDSLRPKPDPGPNYAQLMEEYASNQAAAVPEEIFIMQEFGQKGPRASTFLQEKIAKKHVIQNAFNFYRIFRGLIVDHMFSFHERNESRKFFFSIEAPEAFKVLEAELNFIYDALYTKMETVHSGLLEYISRFVCSAFLVVAFALFSHLRRSNDIHRFDMGVTYALLVGAVFLDSVALIKLVFSDWTVALVEPGLTYLKIQSPLKDKLISFVFAIYRVIPRRKRWSENLYQFNLIGYCLQKRHNFLDKTAENFALQEQLDSIRYTTHEKKLYEEKLKEFIFVVLKEKARGAEDLKVSKSIYSSRGELALLDYDRFCPELVEKSLSEDVEYDESVLMWHIATDICFHYSTRDRAQNQNINRARCKHLSDYLLYLLIMQPNLMLSVSGIAKIRFQDTCEEAEKFFKRSRSPSELDEAKACVKLINVDTTIKPVEVKGDRSKSLLFDAVRLAKELLGMVDQNSEKTWEMMSKVWLELLCYGASHCRGDAHAQKLRTGGELFTYVWLLMAHLGLGEQFRIEAGHARAKLIVKK